MKNIIPKIIHRTVPSKTTSIMDMCWESAKLHNSNWTFMSHQDPLNKEDWPLTGKFWNMCASKAHMADLIRLECLYQHGGIYLDSDIYIVKSLNELIIDKPFAAKESKRWICNAVIGSPKNHPAVLDLINESIFILKSGKIAHGPYVITDIWENRNDILILPKESFYLHDPGSTNQILNNLNNLNKNSNIFGSHIWAGSWTEGDSGKNILKEISHRWETE